ncbi:MAG: glycoside hydrolase family 3 N-terminal domain-containing protein, partial [Pseudomonadota bacterium]
PEPLGLAAIGDPETTHRFADIARQEYRAVGIVQALSPMADLATEPRWPRVLGTFGEDATLAKSQTRAYVTGFQSGEQGLSSKSVASVVKHWAGYGAAKDGYDSHSYYGRFATFPGNNFEEHLTPFVGAFEANVSGVMPTFSILQDLIHNGVEQEQVGGGFNEYLLKDLLRESYGFEGVILSDWSITKDCNDVCKLGIADGKIQDRENISTAWGVIDRSPEERYALALTAGIDQFGGIDSPMYLLKAVSSGLVSEDRLDLSVRRLLIQKFKLGIFEKPFVDETLAQDIVGKNSFQEQAKIAQAKALVLLENKENLLPLGDKPLKVFLYEIDADAAREAGFDPVSTPEAADLAIMRLTTPFEQNHKNYMFGRRHHEGNLAYLPGNPDYDAVKSASQQVPVIATVFLERPAILTSIQNDVSALIGNFGVSDQVLFRVLKGDAEPQGNLPIELPSSMEAVVNQSEDLPYDSESPLYAFGYGLRYGGLSNEK